MKLSLAASTAQKYLRRAVARRRCCVVAGLGAGSGQLLPSRTPSPRRHRRRQYLETDLMPWVLGSSDLGDDVLEIGPGPGLTTDFLRERVETLTALELDEALAADLAKRMDGSNVTVVHGNATASGLPADRFSAVTCFTMLHHVPSPALQDRLFAEVFRVLRPGGTFIGTDATDSPSLRELHIDDIFVPVEAESLRHRLRAVGFDAVTVDAADGRLRFTALTPVE